MANLNPTDTEFFLSRCEREFDPQSGEMILQARNVAHALGLRRCGREVAQWSISRGYTRTLVRWPGDNKTYVFEPWMAQEESPHSNLRFKTMLDSTQPRIATPSLFIGIMRLTPSLTPVLDYMLSNPEKKIALTRIQDNAQLILTEAAAQAMKSDGETAVKRRTDDFWLGEDLEKLQQMYRDYGEVESGFEITYTATLDKPKHDPTAAWGVWTAHYIMKKDNFGLVYRQGELIDLKEISRPLVVA